MQSEELIHLQKKILNKYLIFKKKNIKNININSKILDNNYKKYSYPFVGKTFKPHFTISALKNNSKTVFVRKFLDQIININDLLKEISIYKIENDKHHKIGKIVIR